MFKTESIIYIHASIHGNSIAHKLFNNNIFARKVEKETLKEQGAEFATPLKDVNLSSVYSTPLQINMRASMPEEMNESVEMKEKAPMQLDSSQVLSVSDATTGGLKNAFVPALIQVYYSE